MIRCDQITEIFPSWHDCTSTSSARSSCCSCLQADITIWVLWKVRKYTVRTHCEVLSGTIHGPDEIPKFVEGLDIKTAFDEAKPKHVAKILEGHGTHGWLCAALLREMSGLSGKATLECVESNFSFNRCLRQGSVEAPCLWQKMATQASANVEEEWMTKRKSILLDMEGERAHQICSFMWADNFWTMSHSKEILEQMLRDLIEETSRWD